MTKRLFLLMAVVAVTFAFSVSANAQFGKALKNAGKTAAKSVGDVAGEMAADVAANKVSAKIIEFMDQNNPVVAESSEYFARLSGLVASKYVSVDDLSLTYRIYENAEANILATADGNIRIYTGMMDLLSDDELLAVIAIQIGHLANNDVRDALLKVASEDNAAKATSAQLEKLLSLSGDKLATIVNELIQVPYTDKQSKAADSYAYDLMKKNGTSTGALASVLSKFAEMEAADKLISENEEAEGEYSAAYKYIAVNNNNASRASLIASK